MSNRRPPFTLIYNRGAQCQTVGHRLLFVRVVDLDPHGSVLIGVAGSGSGSRRAKMTYRNKKAKEFSCFEVLHVLF
jgi:hypothetical protein